MPALVSYRFSLFNWIGCILTGHDKFHGGGRFASVKMSTPSLIHILSSV